MGCLSALLQMVTLGLYKPKTRPVVSSDLVVFTAGRREGTNFRNR